MCGIILQNGNPIKRAFENALAKEDGTSLWEHAIGTLTICDHLIKSTPNYDPIKAWQLRTAAFLHDIGKLEKVFQDFLIGNSSKAIKHEKYSLNYCGWVLENNHAISEIVSAACKIPIDKINERDLWGFIISHHGLYYLGIGNNQWKIDRDWTEVNTAEEITITLADLLWRYYPLGGAVIFADLLHSAWLNGDKLWEEIRLLDSINDIKDKIGNHYLQIIGNGGADRKQIVGMDIMKILLMN